MIFPSKPRIDWRIKQESESIYEFWNRCAWPLLDILRNYINHWSENMPVDDEFIGRIRAKKDDRKFTAAMFELVFFTICKHAGLPIERIVASSQRSTDFRLINDPSRPIFLECALVANALEDHNERKRRDYVIQIIDDIVNFPYYISIRFKQTGTSTIPKKKLTKAIQDFADNKFRTGNLELKFEHECWVLVFHFYPKNQLSDRTLGELSGFTNDARDNKKVILAALNEKRPSYYQINQSPYIICLAINDISVDTEELAIALLGHAPHTKINLNVNSNSFFNKGNKPLNTSVSAVIFCQNIQPTSFTETRISVWHNPFATNPISHDLFPFKQYYYSQEGHYLYPQKDSGSFDIFSVLNISRKYYIEYLQLKHRTPPILD